MRQCVCFFSQSMRSKRLLVFAAALFVTAAASAQLRGPTNQMLIPAAGNVPGANGTYFRSDVTLTNFRDTDQRVQLQWLPQTPSTTTPMPAPVFITIPAYSGLASEDFATNYLQQTGLGAILITGVTPTDAPDGGALLFATARIWSPQPGSTGTVSQTFPVVPVGAISPAPQVIILGQRIDARYRTNVGIVNLETGYSRTFDIVQSTDYLTFAVVQTTLTVPPMSMLQVRLHDMPSSVLQVTVTPRVIPAPPPGPPVPPPPPPSNMWVAYASSIDNVTGDSWSTLAMPLLKP